MLTAADILAGVGSDSAPKPELEPEPPAPEPTSGRVVYVYVDDAGVEHEVGEDELDDFEFVDDDDDEENKP